MDWAWYRQNQGAAIPLAHSAIAELLQPRNLWARRMLVQGDIYPQFRNWVTERLGLGSDFQMGQPFPAGTVVQTAVPGCSQRPAGFVAGAVLGAAGVAQVEDWIWEDFLDYTFFMPPCRGGVPGNRWRTETFGTQVNTFLTWGHFPHRGAVSCLRI